MADHTTCYDKHGVPIERGDIVKVFHFVGARRKRHYMYKQCLGLSRYPSSPEGWEKVFFSHLNFCEIGDRNGPYHEEPGAVLAEYEVVQSIKCDHETRLKALSAAPGGGMSVVEFPQGSRCYACFDFTACGDNNCPECGRSVGPRLPVEKRPARPPMFPITEDRPNA